MTRQMSKRPLLGLLATVILTMGMTAGNAEPTLNPTQVIGVNYPYYSYNGSFTYDTYQLDRAATVKSYRLDIPTGWHISLNSLDASSQPSCSALTGANINTSAERLGETIIHLKNDDTRFATGGNGTAIFFGALYFLNYDSLTKTATLCGRATTSVSTIPNTGTNREIMYQVLLKLNGDGSYTMTYDFSAVPGSPAGTRSIYDSPYYQSENTSITYTRVSFQSLTPGNFNKNADGTKSPIRFIWNPDTPGNYAFKATYTPCGLGEPGYCFSTPSPPSVEKTSTIGITNYPTGFHPGGTFTQPALWSVFTGGAPLSIRWSQPSIPAASGETGIKGYALTLSADYVANSTKTIYFVTDPGTPGTANPNPCGVDGAAAVCTFDLAMPYTSDADTIPPADGNYSMNLVTIFKDEHRSDGRCDDDTVKGYDPPCADLSIPARVESKGYVPGGISYTQFMYRTKAWPLVYRQIINTNNSNYGSIYQVYILMADLDGKAFEFVQWKPAGARFPGGGNTINGTNAFGGAIAYAQTSGPQRYYLDVLMGPTQAGGTWILTSSTNDPQTKDPVNFLNMSRIN